MLELVNEKNKQHIAQLLSDLPDSPGVYIHKDENGNIIYIGKAISLKSRVKSYFQSPKSHPPKVIALVKKIADFEYILCSSETEALTLESNLIKTNRPHYNILLKDDKHFPYAKINTNTPYPRIEIVHRITKNDSSKYIGPFLSKHALKESLESLRDIFPLRSCNRDILASQRKKERACLYYHIKKCCAPCINKISQKDYDELVAQSVVFLNGKTQEVVSKLQSQMNDFSQAMEFEKAALVRDRLANINLISQKQNVAQSNNINERDALCVSKMGNDVVVYMLFVRNGKVVGTDHVALIAPDETAKEIMTSFITQYYAQGSYVPKEIIVSDLPNDYESLETWLSQTKGLRVKIIAPIKGEKKKLVEMAKKNGEDFLEKAANAKRKHWETTQGAVKDLAKTLNLPFVPQKIEAFDISHTAGTNPVASMVVFENGVPSPKQYRRFKIKDSQNDDYAAMREVLTRRFARAKADIFEQKTLWSLPDLILVDGGKGQLSSALAVVEEFKKEIKYNNNDFPQEQQKLVEKIETLQLISLAERLEEVFLPNIKESIILIRGCPALHLVQRIRDESHRFAITFHRSLRQKTMLFSQLNDIPGVGKARKKILFDAFSSFNAIKKATYDELISTNGIDKKTAQSIVDFFRETKQ